MKSKIRTKSLRNKQMLMVFIALFACIGTYLLINSRAATTCDQTLSSGANISSAVSSATAGSTICLNDGTYPSLTLSNVNKSSYVTLKSVNGPANVTIAALSLTNISFIRLDGITYIGSGTTLAITGAHDLQIINSIGTSKILRVNITLANSNILFDNDKFINVDPPCYTNNCVEGRLSFDSPGTPPNPAGVTVSNSYFGGGNSDGIQIGSVRGLKIIGNEFNDISAHGTAAHTDPIQLYAGSASAYPMDTVIDSNYIHNTDSNIMSPDGSTNTQITNNVIDNTGYPYPVNAGHWNGGLIEHNTFNISTACPWEAHCGTLWIQSVTNPVIIRNNIMGGLKNDAGSSAVTASRNLTPSGVSVGTNPVNGVPTFVGGTSPTSFSGFALASGSAGKGAGFSTSGSSDGTDIGINIATTPPPPTSLYISPTGSDTAACSQASPCKTLNGAYAKSSPGNTILINAGDYTATSNNSIAYRANMSGSPVVVKPVSGATVTFNDIELLAGNITFQGPNFNARSFDIGRYNGTRITNVTIDGLNIDAKDTLNLTGMNIASVTGLTLKNSRVGNTMAGSGSSDTAKSVEFCGASSTCNAADVTFDHNTFYDADAPSGSLAHLECIFAPGIQGFNVKNNRFQDCTYFDIFITVILANNQAQPKDYIFENNLFGRTVSVGGTEAGYSINMHSDVQPNNIQFLHNTIEGPISTANGGGAIQAGGWTIAGNIISEGVWLSDSGSMDCRSGITFSYNVMPNTCGSNTTTASTTTIKNGWIAQKGVYAGEDDFHLKSTSPAIGKGRPADAGTLDFDSKSRSSPPSAGAYEYQSGSTTPKPGDTNNDGVVNIIDLSTLLSHYNTNFTAADFNKDNIVNIIDLSTLLSNFGK